MKKVLLSLLSVVVLLMFAVPLSAAQSTTDTLAPPDDDLPIQIQSIFGPGYDYLFTGNASITNIGNSKVSISGSSSATQRVDSIGVQMTLQQWTGSTWIDVYKSLGTTSSSSSNTYGNHEVGISKGYYYRVKSDHWIQHGSIEEEGTLYSGSILIPQ